MKKCKELGKIPATMGIDTWGVDYVLLDEKNQILGDTVGYRDSRTNGMDEKVYEKISFPHCMREQVSRSRYSIQSIS